MCLISPSCVLVTEEDAVGRNREGQRAEDAINKQRSSLRNLKFFCSSCFLGVELLHKQTAHEPSAEERTPSSWNDVGRLNRSVFTQDSHSGMCVWNFLSLYVR